MKCAFVNLGKHFGGAENYLITVIDNWIKAGNEAIVIVRQGHLFEKKLNEYIPELKIWKVENIFKDALFFKKKICNEEIELINIHGINSAVFINLINPQIKKITTVHSNAEIDRINKSILVRKLFVLAENFCLKRSEKIIVVSDAIKDLLVERKVDENKISVINNGILLLEYDKKCLRKQTDEVLRICFIGRIEEVKGCEILIRALENVENKNFICDIYGEGSLKHKMQKIVYDMGFGEKIRFCGFSSRIREKLIKYDVLVIPSLYEASPLIIPEAMNAKTILVCSNVGGMAKIIKNKENGYLFEVNNTFELASIIDYIYMNPCSQSYIVENAYNDFLDNYTEEKMIEKTFKILKGEGNRYEKNNGCVWN